IFVEDHGVIAARGVARDQSEANVLGDALRIAPLRIAEPAATRHEDRQYVIARDGLLAFASELATRGKQQRAGLAFASVVASARRKVDAIIIGADAERRVVKRRDFHDLAEPAAEFAGPAGIGAVFLTAYEDWRQCFGNFDRHVTHAARESRR